MTCKQLGGACDLEFQANTFDEIAELSKKHGKEMFEENYPQHKIEGVYNWSGKDWRARPDYNFKDQTGSLTKDKIPHFIQIAEIDARKDERDLLIVEGNIDINLGLDRNYRTITKDELVMNRSKKK